MCSRRVYTVSLRLHRVLVRVESGQGVELARRHRARTAVRVVPSWSGRGDVADGDERVVRALSARRHEKAARLPERISAARLLRGHQEPDGVPRLIGLPRDLWYCMQEARHVRGARRRGRESS